MSPERLETTGENNKIVKKLNELDSNVNELTNKVYAISKCSCGNNATLLGLVVIFFFLLAGFVMFGIWNNKIDVHEAWLLCVVFIGIFTLACFLIKYLFQKDE